eukprot:UN02102
MASPQSPVFTDVSYFIEAARRGEAKTVQGMLENMPSLSTAIDPTNSWNALHYAAHANHLDVLNIVLATQNIDLDQLNGAGETPLHIAVTKEYIDIVLALVRAGASTSIPNAQRLTAYDLSTSDDIRKALGGYDPRVEPVGGGFLVAQEDSDSE